MVFQDVPSHGFTRGKVCTTSLARKHDFKDENMDQLAIMSEPNSAMAALAPNRGQDNYCIRFLRRKSNCIVLFLLLLISLLSVMQVFVTKLDDKLLSSITLMLLNLLKESMNTTIVYTNDTFID